MCKTCQIIDNICTFIRKRLRLHLFAVEFQKVTNIWSILQNWIRIKLGISVVLSKTHIILVNMVYG